MSDSFVDQVSDRIVYWDHTAGRRTTLTQYTDMKLEMLRRDVNELAREVNAAASSMSRLHHADEFRVIVRRLRAVANGVEETAIKLEKGASHGL